MTEDSAKVESETLQDERGDELTPPEAVDVDTAIDIIEALEPILDGGDWRRLEQATARNYEQRRGDYAYTKQDGNLAEKIAKLKEIRDKKLQHEELNEVFGDDE